MNGVTNDSIARVEAALGQLGAEHEPPPGWDTRVLMMVGQGHPWWHWERWWRWSRWWVVLPMGAMGALLWLWLGPGPAAQGKAEPLIAMGERTPSFDPTIEIVPWPAGSTMRGSSAHVGERVHVTTTSTARHHALWVYRNERELVIACPSAASCSHAHPTMSVDLTLKTIGSYRFLVVASESPLPAPRGTFDLDKATAESADARTQDRELTVY